MGVGHASVKILVFNIILQHWFSMAKIILPQISEDEKNHTTIS